MAGQTFTHRIRVRYAECDAQGVVFNANYYAYYDILITELWREALDGGYDAMIQAGADLSVVESRGRFLTPARFDDELDLTATITRLGTTAMSTRVDITKADGTPVTEGEIHHVFIDPVTYSKVPIPEAIRAALAPYLEAAEATA